MASPLVTILDPCLWRVDISVDFSVGLLPHWRYTYHVIANDGAEAAFKALAAAEKHVKEKEMGAHNVRIKGARPLNSDVVMIDDDQE